MTPQNPCAEQLAESLRANYPNLAGSIRGQTLKAHCPSCHRRMELCMIHVTHLDKAQRVSCPECGSTVHDGTWWACTAALV